MNRMRQIFLTKLQHCSAWHAFSKKGSFCRFECVSVEKTLTLPVSPSVGNSPHPSQTAKFAAHRHSHRCKNDTATYWCSREPRSRARRTASSSGIIIGDACCASKLPRLPSSPSAP